MIELSTAYDPVNDMVTVTMGDGDPESRAPWAWAPTLEAAIAELYAFEDIPEGTPYTIYGEAA